MRFGTDTLHLDNDTITKVAQLLDNHLMKYRLDVPMPQGLTAITQSLDDSMACRQSDGTTIRADVLNTIQGSQHWRPDDAIDECYNDKMSEKFTI